MIEPPMEDRLQMPEPYDPEIATQQLRRARAAVVCGRHPEALELAESLLDSRDRTIAFRACLQAARARYLLKHDTDSSWLMRLLGERGYSCRKLSPTLVLELARTVASVGGADDAKKIYERLIERLAERRAEVAEDTQAARIRALAHYRLGHLYMDSEADETDAAYFHWRKAHEAREVEEVSPYASYALASRIGRPRLPLEHIELMYLHAVRSSHLALAAQARLQLVDFLAQQGQLKSARDHLEVVSEQVGSADAERVKKRLVQLEIEASVAPLLRPVHDAVELRRTSNRLIVKRMMDRGGNERSARRVIIVGVGTGGRYLLEALNEREDKPLVCGFVDDDMGKIPPERMPMLGNIDTLEATIKREGADEVLMAIPTASGDRRLDVVKACRAAKVRLHSLPSIHGLAMGWDTGRSTLLNQLRPVKIEETIGRKDVRIDEEVIEWAHGLRVLVVGAKDIGAEICRRLALGTIESLVIIDTDESALTRLGAELSEWGGSNCVTPIVADWLHPECLAREIAIHRPSLIINAAGLTSEWLAERSRFASTYRDVLGARTIAKVACEADVRRMLYVSDTRAGRPGVFGAFKALSEQAVLVLNDAYRSTSCSVVRITAPMGTESSILSRIAAQIDSGGPVSVPGPGAAARFLSAARTAELVLHAARLMEEQNLRGLLALDAGDVRRIKDVAEEMIRLRGLDPSKDMAVTVDQYLPEETPVELRGEPVIGQREILRLHRGVYPSATVDALIERLKRLPDDVDETRTLALKTIELANAIPDFEDRQPTALS